MANILEQAGHINYTSAATAFVSSSDAGAVRYRTVDQNTKPDITCLFQDATRATVAAVQAFYADHRTGFFSFTVPDAGVGSGATVLCEFLGPPEIRWARNARTAAITVRMRRTLLRDD